MSFQAYLENIKAKTGKTPEDFAKLAQKKGLAKHGEIVAWLKDEFGLGHGHATAIAGVLLKSGKRGDPSQRLDTLFSGKRASWRMTSDKLVAKVQKFGPDVVVAANETYVNLLRKTKKFGIIQPAAERLDIGIKLKGVPPEGRFDMAGAWNAMVTHRVRLGDAREVDAELLAWLRRAYEAQGE
jgi:Domain of unknown function (DUF4287)/Domain of unknown function (DUF5655)